MKDPFEAIAIASVVLLVVLIVWPKKKTDDPGTGAFVPGGGDTGGHGASGGW